MSKFKFELNEAGVRELLRSDSMMGICKGYAEDIRDKCGDGHEITTHRGTVRVNASTPAAVQGNLKNNTLLKATGVRIEEEQNGAEVRGRWRHYIDPYRGR